MILPTHTLEPVKTFVEILLITGIIAGAFLFTTIPDAPSPNNPNIYRAPYLWLFVVFVISGVIGFFYLHDVKGKVYKHLGLLSLGSFVVIFPFLLVLPIFWFKGMTQLDLGITVFLLVLLSIVLFRTFTAYISK